STPLTQRPILDLPTFNCWSVYFLTMNLNIDRLANYSSATKFEVRSLPLLGQERLWDIALQSRNPQVTRAAIHLLIRLHTQLFSTLRKHNRDIRLCFLQTPMDILLGNSRSKPLSSSAASPSTTATATTTTPTIAAATSPTPPDQQSNGQSQQSA